MIFYRYEFTPTDKTPGMSRYDRLKVIATPTWLGHIFFCKAKTTHIFLKPWTGWKFESTGEYVNAGLELAAGSYASAQTADPPNNHSPWDTLTGNKE